MAPISWPLSYFLFIKDFFAPGHYFSISLSAPVFILDNFHTQVDELYWPQIFLTSLVAVVAQPCLTLCPHGLQHVRLSWSLTISWSLLKLMSVESVMLSNHLILCRPPSPSPFSLFQHRGLFQWAGSSYGGQSTEDSTTVLSVNIQSWFPLGLIALILEAHKTLSSLLYHYNSKASILQCSAFSMAQLLTSWVSESLSVVSDSLWPRGL